MAIIGAALIVSNVGSRLVLARHLRREGAPVRLAWRRLYLSPMAWLGLILLVSSISRPAGGVVLLAFATVSVAFLAMGFVRGVWRFPTAVRLVGDPEAWRGNRLPYWENRDIASDDRQRNR